MNKKEFYDAVKAEGLEKYNIGESKVAVKFADVVGYYNNDGWIVYRTNERGALQVIDKYDSEEDALDALLVELREKKER